MWRIRSGIGLLTYTEDVREGRFPYGLQRKRASISWTSTANSVFAKLGRPTKANPSEPPPMKVYAQVLGTACVRWDSGYLNTSLIIGRDTRAEPRSSRICSDSLSL